jgi:tetratricopeptide (TPR) repeat protein
MAVSDHERTDASHDEVIEPARLDLRQRAPISGARAPRARSRLPIAVILTVLIAVAVGVVFVLPGWVADRGAEQAVPAPVVEAPVAEVPPEPVLSPEELARLRDEAERLLAMLLPQQGRLEDLSAESWGGEAWVDYEAAARDGDDAYLANEFQNAVPAYQRALDIGEGLLGRAGDIVSSALDAGQNALVAGNAIVAQQQFSLVLGVEPDNATAAAALARAEKLPDVLALVQQAETLAREGELDDSAARYREALEMDPEWHPARQALAEVERRIQDRRFESLMSRGYAALASEDFTEAGGHFAAALELRPGSEDAANGRLLAEQGTRLDQIALIEARAAAFERRELWTEAIAQYQSALETDATLQFAQLGLERARERADLDSKLAHLLANPNLLFDDRVLNDAQGLLGTAATVATPGPRLTEQTSELGRLIRLASTPITVEIQSDQLTEVSVYRVGSLGMFAQTTLELRPGTYTAIGSRDGYRDVRETFTLLPGRPVPPIRVACVEPI